MLEPSGNVWVGGAPSQGFPLVTPYEANGAGSDFVSEFSADLSQLLFSSYSDGANLAVDPSGAIYVSGSARPGGCIRSAYSTASLVKIDPAGTPPVIINSIDISTTNPNASALLYLFRNRARGVDQYHGAESGAQHYRDGETGRDRPAPVPGGRNQRFVRRITWRRSSRCKDGLIVCFAPFEITGSAEVTVTVDGQKSNSVRVACRGPAPIHSWRS